MKLKSVIGALLASSLVLAGCGSGAADEGEIKLTFGSAAAPNHPITPAAKQFKKDVEKATDGRVRIVLQLNGVLGDEVSMAESNKRGTLEMGALSDVSFANIEPTLGVTGLPYLFKDEDEVVKYYYDGFLGAYAAKQLEKHDIKVLGWMDNGFRALSNSKHEVTSAKDVKGLRLRVVQSPALIDFFDELGAKVTPMPITELLTSLQQGLVDGQENGITLTQTFGFGDVQKFMTETNHAFSGVPITINTKAWAKLSAEDQKAVAKAATAAGEYQRELYAEQIAEAKKKLEASGVKFSELTPDALIDLSAVSQEIWNKYAPKFDADVMKQINAELTTK